jgi:hypothetical protein
VPMNAVAPSQSTTSIPRRVNVHGKSLPVGLVRGLLALILVGTLILSLFVSPPDSMSTLTTALETLVVAIIGFYFGSRATKRPGVTTTSKPVSQEPANPTGGTGGTSGGLTGVGVGPSGGARSG